VEIFPEDVISDKAHKSLEAKMVEFVERLKQITEESEQGGADQRLKRAGELRKRPAQRIEEAENH